MDKQITISDDRVRTKLTVTYSEPQDGLCEKVLIYIKNVPGKNTVQIEKYADRVETKSISITEYSFAVGMIMGDFFHSTMDYLLKTTPTA